MEKEKLKLICEFYVLFALKLDSIGKEQYCAENLYGIQKFRSSSSMFVTFSSWSCVFCLCGVFFNFFLSPSNVYARII